MAEDVFSHGRQSKKNPQPYPRILAHLRFGSYPTSEASEPCLRWTPPLQKLEICLLTNLSVGHANETVIHQLISLCVPWSPLHDVTLS